MKEKLFQIANFIFGAFLPKVTMEFLWLLCSVSLGMFIIQTGAALPPSQVNDIITRYSAWLIQILFGASILRIGLVYTLLAIDKYLDRIIESRREQLNMARTGIQLALQMMAVRTKKQDEKK